MRPATLRATIGSALLGLAAQNAFASKAHRHAHHLHSSNHTHQDHGLDQVSQTLKPRGRLVNRSGQCAFPEGEGLVAITPSSLNRGWAMSPDQECTAGSYCPYACEPGMVMNQWRQGTTYQYPESMDGGVYCDKYGDIVKPFPHQPYCVEGVGNVRAVNNCGDPVAFCQTVLPGNEAMLIPTCVSDSAIIAVPGPSYWDSTASHFYINPPGWSTEEACAWGTGSHPTGNWSPYVAGANQDSSGNTWLKIGYNPTYTGDFYGVKPSFGLEIECDGNCNGLPCKIDPSFNEFGVVWSAEAATGAGGADFCVVTVPQGASANIVVFSTDKAKGSPSGTDDQESRPLVPTSVRTKPTHEAHKTAKIETTRSPHHYPAEEKTTTAETHRVTSTTAATTLDPTSISTTAPASTSSTSSITLSSLKNSTYLTNSTFFGNTTYLTNTTSLSNSTYWTNMTSLSNSTYITNTTSLRKLGDLTNTTSLGTSTDLRNSTSLSVSSDSTNMTSLSDSTYLKISTPTISADPGHQTTTQLFSMSSRAIKSSNNTINTPTAIQLVSSTLASPTTLSDGIFHESGMASGNSPRMVDITTVAAAAIATASSKSDAVSPDQGRAAIAGLAIAFVGAALLY